MSKVMTSMKKMQDDVLHLVDRVEEPIVKYTGEAAERVAPYIPERPEWAFMEEVPAVTEVMDSQLRFTKRFVDRQIVFARNVMKAMEPALKKLDHKPAKATAAGKAAARPAAKATRSTKVA
jgi:hypothetical protein